MNDSDTIAAISTALGNAGIHIIRISGPDSFDIIKKIFKKGKSCNAFDAALYDSHTIHYGYIYDGDSCIDEVMVSLFKAPNSYTKEDVAEINCHGGSYVAKLMLKIIINNGARLAMPGEFTKRSFLNGRIDLSQAESVMDIIKSQNEYALMASVNHLKGDIKEKISGIRETVLYELAFIEAALDDPEHYSLDNYTDELKDKIKNVIKELEALLKSYNNGRIINEGISTAIIGKPNVGKSSFLNFIMKDDRAIVTDIPGTTRDIIEYSININNITLNLMDTAGIHDTKDYIEQIGIEKTLDIVKKAQLIICMFDMSRDFDSEDEYILSLIKDCKSIVLLNKSDAETKLDKKKIKESVQKCIEFSTVTGEGYNELVDTIEKLFFSGNIDVENETYITNIRHMEAISSAIKSLLLVNDNIESGMPEDLITIDMLDAYNFLGEITGDTVSDSLIDKIFSEFCMGK